MGRDCLPPLRFHRHLQKIWFFFFRPLFRSRRRRISDLIDLEKGRDVRKTSNQHVPSSGTHVELSHQLQQLVDGGLAAKRASSRCSTAFPVPQLDGQRLACRTGSAWRLHRGFNGIHDFDSTTFDAKWVAAPMASWVLTRCALESSWLSKTRQAVR